MRFISLLSIFILAHSVCVYSQQASDSLYVGLKSGKLIKASTLLYKTPVFGSPHLLVDDSIRFKINEVRFFRSLAGYFLQVRSVSGYEALFKRNFEGKISLYSREVTNYNAYGVTSYEYEFLHKQGKDTLLKANAANTILLTSDNPKCLPLLKQIKAVRTYNLLAYSIGSLIALGGVIHMSSLNATPGPPPYPDTKIKLSPFLFIGGAIALTPSFTNIGKREKIHRVISLYNQ